MKFQFFAILIVASLFTASGCQEAPTDAIVSGGSMAPSYRGEHFQLMCDECQYPFSIDANNVPKSGLAVCPNCGNPQIRFSDQTIQPSTRMTVHQLVGAINRWDVIAFNEPGSNNRDKKRLLTKRVVGLPGETVQFRGGNLLINGDLVRKPAELNQQIRIPVFDSRFKQSSKSKRLVPSNDDSGWNADSDGWSFNFENARKEGQASIDWLDYHHIRGYRHSSERYEVYPIEDDYGYNQNVARQLHRVNEVMLQLQIENDANSRLVVSLFRYQAQRCLVEFQFDRQKILISTNNEPAVEVDASWLSAPKSLIEISNFDRQLRISQNHKTKHLQTIAAGNVADSKPIRESSESDSPATVPPVQIRLGAANGNVRISNLQIFRDIYYYRESVNTADDAVKFELGADEYLVLGDNAPISVDSRIFGPILRSSIVGLVQPAGSDD